MQSGQQQKPSHEMTPTEKIVTSLYQFIYCTLEERKGYGTLEEVEAQAEKIKAQIKPVAEYDQSFRLLLLLLVSNQVCAKKPRDYPQLLILSLSLFNSINAQAELPNFIVEFSQCVVLAFSFAIRTAAMMYAKQPDNRYSMPLFLTLKQLISRCLDTPLKDCPRILRYLHLFLLQLAYPLSIKYFIKAGVQALPHVTALFDRKSMDETYRMIMDAYEAIPSPTLEERCMSYVTTLYQGLVLYYEHPFDAKNQSVLEANPALVSVLQRFKSNYFFDFLEVITTHDFFNRVEGVIINLPAGDNLLYELIGYFLFIFKAVIIEMNAPYIHAKRLQRVVETPGDQWKSLYDIVTLQVELLEYFRLFAEKIEKINRYPETQTSILSFNKRVVAETVEANQLLMLMNEVKERANKNALALVKEAENEKKPLLKTSVVETEMIENEVDETEELVLPMLTPEPLLASPGTEPKISSLLMANDCAQAEMLAKAKLLSGTKNNDTLAIAYGHYYLGETYRKWLPQWRGKAQRQKLKLQKMHYLQFNALVDVLQKMKFNNMDNLLSLRSFVNGYLAALSTPVSTPVIPSLSLTVQATLPPPLVLDAVPAVIIADPSVLTTLNTFYDAKYEAYVVGGAVRDLLLQKPIKDYDIVTTATMEEIDRLMKGRGEWIGHRFPVYLIKGDKDIQITRMQGSEPLQTKAAQLLADAKHRDFTVNTFYVDTRECEVIDPLGALDDLKSNQLKFVIDAAESITIDPMRMVRAIRLEAKTPFKLSSELLTLFKQSVPLLLTQKKTRLNHDLTESMKVSDSAQVLTRLDAISIFPVLFSMSQEASARCLERLRYYLKQAHVIDYEILWAIIMYDSVIPSIKQPAKEVPILLAELHEPTDSHFKFEMKLYGIDPNQYQAISRVLYLHLLYLHGLKDISLPAGLTIEYHEQAKMLANVICLSQQVKFQPSLVNINGLFAQRPSITTDIKINSKYGV